jgi:tRNA(Glu) U13 pseudouridine synthase TruD
VLLKPTDATLDIPSAPDAPIRLRFTLPAGAYATVFVDSLLDSR